MLFHSFHFLVFFPLVTVGYFLCPFKRRWVLLLLASCYFYMVAIPAYIFILLFTITFDYFSAIFIEQSVGRRRRFFLLASLSVNLGVLCVFKYSGFFVKNLVWLNHALGGCWNIQPIEILLPIGLSFHTFQSMSYTIEVYRGNQKAERNFGIVALYVMFYPQLVAGPIERGNHLLPQFREKHEFDYGRITSGLRLMAWGFFKKLVIADKMALIVDPTYRHPERAASDALFLATFCFAFQIYCDFSGYTDIAIGAARVMGFRLMTNFKTPYLATSISDFWHRWHISLSSWFRDYVYVPLGGNRGGKWRHYWNFLATFLLSGLWHGASWTFVVWGALHGFYLIGGSILKPVRSRLIGFLELEKFPFFLSFFRVLTTFSLVLVGWVFFRANTVSDAFFIVSQLPAGFVKLARGLLELQFVESFFTVGPPRISQLLVSVGYVAIVVLLAVEIAWWKYGRVGQWFIQRPWWIRWFAYYALILVILTFGEFRQSPFIYFQF